jgi:hypothetical protein
MLLWEIYRRIRPQLTAFSELRPWLPFALFFCFLPLPFAIIQGQDSLLVVLLLVASFTRMRTNDLFLAGVLLGLASFRFQYTLIFFILFLVWSAWKFLFGYLVSAFSCFLLSVAAVGCRAQIEYVRLLQIMSSAPTSMPLSYSDRTTAPVLYMVNLRALVKGLGGGPSWTIVASILVLAIVYVVGNRSSRSNQLLLTAVATCLVSYHAFFYDLSILILPLTILMNSALKECDFKLLTSVAIVIAIPELVALTVPFTKTWLNAWGVLWLFIVACKWAWDRRPEVAKNSGSQLQASYAQS